MAADAPFAGIGCEAGHFPTETGETNGKNTQKMAALLGMNKTCERVAATKASTQSSSGGFQSSTSAELGPFGMLGKIGHSMGSNWQDSATALDTSFREAGCGNFMVDSKTILDSVKNISCTLTETLSESTVGANAAASVSIRIVPDPGVEQRVMNLQRDTLNASIAMATMGQRALAQRMSLSYDLMAKANVKRGTIDITNTTIRTKAGVGVRQLNQASITQAAAIHEESKKIAKTTANNLLQQHSGAMALQNNVKSLVDTKFTSLREDFNADVDRMISRTNVSSTGSASIEIVAPVAIALRDSVLSSEVLVDVVATSVAATSIELGKTIASELLTEAASYSSTSQENKGLEALQDSMAAGNTALLRAQNEGLWNMNIGALGGVQSVLLLVGIAAVCFAVLRMMDNEKPSSGRRQMYVKMDS